MRKHLLIPLLFILLPTLLIAQYDAEYDNYLAHITAAGASLRLDDLDAARRFIDGAASRHRGWEWEYLSRQVEGSYQQLKLSGQAPTHLDVSHDGRWLTVTTADSSVYLFETGSWRLVKRLDLQVCDTRLLGQADQMVTCTRDGQLVVSTLANGTTIWKASGGGQGTGTLAVSPNGKLIAYASWKRSAEGVEGFFRLFDAADGKSLAEEPFGRHPVTSIQFSADGHQLALSNRDGEVAVWNLANMDKTLHFQVQNGELSSQVDDLAFSPNGLLLGVASRDGHPQIWNLKTGKQAVQLDRCTEPVFSVVFSPDNKQLITGGTDATLQAWEVKSGQLLRKYYGHANRVQDLAFFPNRSLFASTSIDGSVRIWKWIDRRPFMDPKGTVSYNYILPVSLDGRWLATSGAGGVLCTWDTWNERMVARFPGLPGGLPTSAAFSPKGNRLVVANAGSAAIVFDPFTGRIILELDGRAGGFTSLAYSPEGTLIAAAARDSSVRIWDAESGALVATLPHRAPVLSVAFSNDGNSLASGDAAGVLRMWSPVSFRQLFEKAGAHGAIYALAFSPTDDKIAIGGERGAGIRTATHGAEVYDLAGHALAVRSLCWSPDGSRLATGSDDRSMRLWHLATGQSVLQISGVFNTGLHGLCFSPDGARLYAAAVDAQVRVFSTGKEAEPEGVGVIAPASEAGGR